jgi:protein-disulfide isomerase
LIVGAGFAQPLFFLPRGHLGLKIIRSARLMAVKTRAVSADALFLLLAMSTVTGCAAAPSANDLTAESAGRTAKDQSAASQIGTAPAGAEPFIKIIIYTDFQCGACERLHSQIEPELRDRYVATGEAQIETRVVGALGEESVRAGEAALCAADQRLFPEYQAALFAAWRQMDGDAYSTGELVALAGTLGLDKEALQRCLDSGCKRPELENNLAMAKAAGVHTLPAVAIGGTIVQGYRPLAVYTRAIESAWADRSSQ